MRTAFFGGYNKRDEPFEIENLHLDFDNKEIPKNCRHLKLAFLDILKGFDQLDQVDENNYVIWRKNKIIYKYKEFLKFFKDHMKKERGHA